MYRSTSPPAVNETFSCSFCTLTGPWPCSCWWFCPTFNSSRGWKCYLLVVLICLSLVNSDAEPLSLCSYATRVSSRWNVSSIFFFFCLLFKLVMLFSYCWIFIALHVLRIQVYCGLCDVQIFSPSLSWSFHSLNHLLPRAKVFKFWKVSFTYIYVYIYIVLGARGVVPKNSLADLRSQRFSPLLSWEVLWLAFHMPVFDTLRVDFCKSCRCGSSPLSLLFPLAPRGMPSCWRGSALLVELPSPFFQKLIPHIHVDWFLDSTLFCGSKCLSFCQYQVTLMTEAL